MPEEEDVLHDFWFNNVPFGEGRSILLGVYGGLYLSGKFSAEDLHAWRVAGIVVDKINEFYLSKAAGSRGAYFPWFLEHCHLLNRPMTRAKQNELW